MLSPPRFLSHTLGYNLTFQKCVSGFKTHQTAPAAKGIHVWIVVFDLMTFMNEHYNVLHVEYPIDDAQLGDGAGAALSMKQS